MTTQQEQEQRLFSVVNAVETAEQLDEAISPLLALVARRFHQSDTFAYADAIIRARLSLPHTAFTTIDQIAEALTAPRSLLVELRRDLVGAFMSTFEGTRLQLQVLKAINEAERESDFERFLLPRLPPVQGLVGDVEPHELAVAILASRHQRQDDRFTAIEQLADVVASTLLRRAMIQLIRRELLRGLGNAPWTTHPALLLPLRLETRFQERKLLVRVYPDQFSVDTHRQQLSSAEYNAIRSYVESPSDRRIDSWRMLSTRFGPSRAAWLVTWASDHDFDSAGPELRQTSWTDPPRLRALPDRFCVFAYRGEKVLRKVSRSVRKDRAMVGTFRPTVRLELGGEPGTVVPRGSLATHNQTGVQWSLNSNATIGADGIARGDATATSGTPTIEAATDWSIHSRVPGWETVKSSGASSLVDGLFDESSKWVFDFDTAVRDGFALELELEDDDFDDEGIPRGFDKVIVVGVQWGTARGSAQQLEHLFQAHRFTDGLEFLPAGAPTNNTEQQASGYSTREDHESTYQTHIVGPPNWNAQAQGEARTNGQRLSKALGIDAELLRFVEGSGETGDSHAHEMNVLTWRVTGDYYLRHLLSGSLSGQELARLKEHHALFVRGGGPLPTLRVGKQPYGILPVTRVLPVAASNGGWAPWDGDASADDGIDADLHGTVTRLYTRWFEKAQLSQCVPRVQRRDSDPDRTLLQILSMQPQSVSFRARPFVDERFITWLLVVLRDYAFGPGSPYEGTGLTPAQWILKWLQTWDSAKARAASLLTELAPPNGGATFQNLPLLRMLAWFEGRIDPVRFVEDSSHRENVQSIPEYLLDIAASGSTEAQSLLATVAQDALALAPDTGSRQETKEALRLLAGSSALDFFNAVSNPQQIVDQIRDDPDLHPERRGYGVRRTLAERILARRDELGRFTSLQQIDDIFGVGPDTLHDILYSFEEFHGQPDFDRLFREALDVSSHRVDAWVTSFATKRLEGMRSEQRAPEGIHIGAYGFVEDLRVRETPTSEGYFHAPSGDQAAAAAVLCNAYLTHDPSQTREAGETRQANPFRINLTSTRVRHGLRIIQGIREGQSLGALLGYQFERSLRERNLHLMQYVDDFREMFPTVAHKVTQTDEAVDTVAARTVLDGKALAQSYRTLSQTDIDEWDPATKKLGAILDPRNTGTQDIQDLETELRHLEDALDAVSDLLVTEGVYQAVHGNYERAGAVLAATSGEQMPPDLEVTATPVAGRRYTNRVCMVFNEKGQFDFELDPRAAAEPRVAAWFSQLLGGLANVGAGVDFWEEETDKTILKRVNVNTAGVDSLATLPGIHEQLALDIVEERKRRPFKQLADLARINGIGSATVADLRSQATTGYVERINVNTASTTLLQTLPGIGPELADSVFAARPLAGIDDLVRVNGINENKLSAIRPRIVAPLVDLNVASRAELEAIPGVGTTLADRILQSREYSEFEGIADLLKVEGFDQALLSQIEPFLSTDFEVVRLAELNVGNEQRFSQTDFLYAAQSTPGGGATELEQRIAQVVRRRHGLPASQRIEIHPARHGRYARSLADAVELAQQCLRPLSAARPLAPHQLCHPGDVDVDVEGYTLQEIARLRARVRAIQEGLSDSGDEHRGVIRKFEEVQFQTRVKLVGTPGTRVPEDTQLCHPGTGAVWFIADTAVLPLNPNGAEAVEMLGWARIKGGQGPVTLELNTQFKILTPVLGLERVETVAPATPRHVVDAKALLQRATQYGIDVLAPDAEPGAELSVAHDQALAELKRRHKASMQIIPKLNVNSAALDELAAAVGGELAQLIIAARPVDGFAKIADVEACLRTAEAYTASPRIVRQKLTTSEVAPTTVVRDLVQALKKIFGKSFIALPEFTPIRPADLDHALMRRQMGGAWSPNPLGEDRLRLWLQQCGEVQPAVATLEDTLLYADVWTQASTDASAASFGLDLAQLPHEPGRAWVGLSDDERGPEPVRPDWHRSPLSLVLASHGAWPQFVDDDGNATGEVTAGLVIDEWSELIPAREVETSVAFHYDAPGSQAPQALLLAVPGVVHEVAGLWTPEELANIVKDTMDLAKVRAVDLDALAADSSAKQGPLGAIMPGVYIPADSSRPSWARDIATGTIEDWFNELVVEEPEPAEPEFVLDDVFNMYVDFNTTGQIWFSGNDIQIRTLDGSAIQPVLLAGGTDSATAGLADGGFRIEFPTAQRQVGLHIGWRDGTQRAITVRDASDSELDCAVTFTEWESSDPDWGSPQTLAGHGSYRMFFCLIRADGMVSFGIVGASLVNRIVTYNVVEEG